MTFLRWATRKFKAFGVSEMSKLSHEARRSLLDMQVSNGEELLEKYGLKANDAVLAEGKQKEM